MGTFDISDMTAFLYARIAEDEARLDSHGADMDHCQECGFGQQPESPYSHKRLRAEVAAKRAIVACRDVLGPDSPRWHAMDRDEIGAYGEWEETLRTLSAVYTDHADYRPEWAL